MYDEFDTTHEYVTKVKSVINILKTPVDNDNILTKEKFFKLIDDVSMMSCDFLDNFNDLKEINSDLVRRMIQHLEFYLAYTLNICMKHIKYDDRYKWSSGGVCASMSSTNMVVLSNGFSKADWEVWVEKHPYDKSKSLS